MFTHKLLLNFCLVTVTIGTEGDIVCHAAITQAGFTWAEDKQATQYLHGPEKAGFTTAKPRQIKPSLDMHQDLAPRTSFWQMKMILILFSWSHTL